MFSVQEVNMTEIQPILDNCIDTFDFIKCFDSLMGF